MGNGRASDTEATYNDFKEQEALAERMLPIIGDLYRQTGVITLMYGRPLMYRPPTSLLDEHRYVRSVEENDFSIRDTFPLLEAMAAMTLCPARIDIGKLGMRWREAGKPDAATFLGEQLKGCVDQPRSDGAPSDVVLYGFGRIGRLVARLLMERAGNGEGMRLRAIVVRKGKAANDLSKRASLLARDSVHGPFRGNLEVDHDNQTLIINGETVKVIYSDGPDQLDYTAYGIDNAIICDNTGVWRDEAGLGLHLKSKGAGKVLLTAPGKGDIKNIVCGVNDGLMTQDDRILSAASCTTNAIVPVLKAVNDKFGIVSGHIESVHSYTNDQNLIDNYHKAERRGRSAPLNMVLTTTGAAKAVTKALPELGGKLTGNAIRVPTPNVSMAIMNLALEQEVTVDELNGHLRWSAIHGPMHKQIDYSASTEIVSSDVVGNRFAGVVDSRATIVNGKHCTLYTWYDNEFGYSVQVVRVLQRMAGINYPFFPAEAAA
jgi:glyceraldehyde 3-phosphate dehydrogenase